uniref:Uncharacterized protein n=1 Tax=Leptocylindrus danicus TaxID=163516 RepID=A0A7S2PPK8_9STRA|mmetsp:Transcript_7017/g.10495  ORF Transcript_7017/g.10495 Transcript_7017/m.10495 type:complete len:136 (+) Transcript_7017:126-533(+)|eukprot:CAMPEP_0116033662 /NCGR_PEP_ID=MMETSP0321-20121206/19134_1 /TAXON_ID=163516 /ORGANISM="Leptocylindrus danicus var. danicus, Strain B650" /LENGTH=135 /DNA_ID=CAMNT_0003509803 /DNA_START=126 /DNA_END=533 /DNA_ORIENTATION=-
MTKNGGAVPAKVTSSDVTVDTPVNGKPGQKYPTPTAGAGDRVFYETLFRQRPSSKMAQEWCLFYGVLPESEAAQLYKVVMKRKAKGKSNSKDSSVNSPARKRKKSTGSRKKIIDDAIGDPGMQSGGVETVTSAVM